MATPRSYFRDLDTWQVSMTVVELTASSAASASTDSVASQIRKPVMSNIAEVHGSRA